MSVSGCGPQTKHPQKSSSCAVGAFQNPRSLPTSNFLQFGKDKGWKESISTGFASSGLRGEEIGGPKASPEGQRSPPWARFPVHQVHDPERPEPADTQAWGRRSLHTRSGGAQQAGVSEQTSADPHGRAAPPRAESPSSTSGSTEVASHPAAGSAARSSSRKTRDARTGAAILRRPEGPEGAGSRGGVVVKGGV